MKNFKLRRGSQRLVCYDMENDSIVILSEVSRYGSPYICLEYRDNNMYSLVVDADIRYLYVVGEL